LIPITLGRFPVIATVVGVIFEQEALHLSSNFYPLFDIEHTTLLIKEFVEFRITVFPVIGWSLTGKTRIV
jgi:hypothetical protein